MGEVAHDGVFAELDPAGAVLWSQHLGTVGDDQVEGLSFDATGSLLMAGIPDSKVRLRVFSGQEQTWEWSTDQPLEFMRSARSGDEAVVIASSPTDDVDLGSGSLAGRGSADFVIARIRR